MRIPCRLVTSLFRPTRITIAELQRSSAYSTGSSLQLIAELRKRTNVTIQKAREALVASNGDVPGALDWLEKDRITTGQRKIEKLGDRFAREGLIGVSVLSRGSGDTGDSGVRAAMVELNCETDFVGRNELFRSLVQDLAFTTAFITEPQTAAHKPNTLLRTVELTHLRDAPLMVRRQDASRAPKTVSEAIGDAITAVGENINIRRAVTMVHDPIPQASGVGLRASSYVHGALTPPPGETRSAIIEAQGKIGALVAICLKTSSASRLRELLQDADFNDEMSMLERALARQIVGMKPCTVHGKGEDALSNQAFIMLASSEGQSVDKVLSKWAERQGMIEGNLQEEGAAGLGVADFVRWQVGEGL